MAKTMTPARLAWLRSLRDDGPQERPPHSRVGYDCMHNEWTEWDYRLPNGKEATSYQQMREAYGEDWFGLAKMHRRERLTLQGHIALKKSEMEGDIQTGKQWK